MFVKRLIWDDFNGKQHTEDVYFNMMVPEFADLNFNPEVGGDFGDYMRDGMKSGKGEVIYTMFRLLVAYSYGRRSEDGAEFHKNPEWTKSFMASKAWEQMFLWLTEPGKDWQNAGAFWEGIFPEAFREQVNAVNAANNTDKDLSELSKDELLALYAKSLESKKPANS